MKKEIPMYKLIYKIYYIPTPTAVKISDFMAKADLGIEAIGITDEFIITTKTKPTEKYLAGIEKILKQAIEENKGKLLDIKLKEMSKTL